MSPSLPREIMTPEEIAEIRKLREEAEAIARDVARLNGRLDIIKALLPEIQADTGSRSEPAIR